MIRRLLRDRPLRDAVKRAHYRATVPDPTWTPEEAFDAWLRERENVDRMTAAFHGAQDKLRTARRACDHWKARAEHLASEKSEADMRYADTRWLLEGMARRASELRRQSRTTDVLPKNWRADIADISDGPDGMNRICDVVLSWLDTPKIPSMSLAEWERELLSKEAQRESVADAAEGDETAEYESDDDFELVIPRPEQCHCTGQMVVMTHEKGMKGCIHTPAPSEREGDKQ